jgi:replicative DNA helicase
MTEPTKTRGGAPERSLVEPLSTPSDVPRLARLGDLRDEWLADAEMRHRARGSGAPLGPVSGLSSLDRAIGGHLPDGVTTLHGAPGTGKTALGLQVAGTWGGPSLYLTAEMSCLVIVQRVVARVTETRLGTIWSGALSPAQSLALLDRAIRQVPDLAIADASLAYAAPPWIGDAARSIRGDGPGVLIVVDSLHSWARGSGVPGPEYDLLNEALAALRRLAADVRCPIVTISERNRQSMQAGGLHAGAGTRQIEYGAELVLDLGPAEEARAGPDGEVAVRLKVAKNRNGPSGQTVDLWFSGAYQRFTEGR